MKYHSPPGRIAITSPGASKSNASGGSQSGGNRAGSTGRFLIGVLLGMASRARDADAAGGACVSSSASTKPAGSGVPAFVGRCLVRAVSHSFAVSKAVACVHCVIGASRSGVVVTAVLPWTPDAERAGREHAGSALCSHTSSPLARPAQGGSMCRSR